MKTRYGFISQHDTKDFFDHQTTIQNRKPRKYLPSLGDSKTVEFDVVQSQKGMQASNFTGPIAAAVRGSTYLAHRGRSLSCRRRRAPRRYLPQGHLTSDTEGSDSTWEDQDPPRKARPHLADLQGWPRLPPCYQQRPYGRQRPHSHTPLPGQAQGVQDAQGPAAPKHQMHTQDQGGDPHGQQPTLRRSPHSQPDSLKHQDDTEVRAA
ncbi:Y-box-binding protein 1-like [Ochotona curzoniae]|uniref:Y-box-binding protein 1-like n=1 Tax=Ochotona curzoniae TaxID=130825 RepID=UPI001B352EB4|nr:Y-box-binding protein 1-like [Ochotona curzoniae]